MAEGAECFVTGVADYFVADVAECFVGAFFVVLSACHYPNLPHVPLYSCKCGNAVPMNISLQLAWASPLHHLQENKANLN